MKVRVPTEKDYAIVSFVMAVFALLLGGAAMVYVALMQGFLAALAGGLGGVLFGGGIGLLIGAIIASFTSQDPLTPEYKCYT